MVTKSCVTLSLWPPPTSPFISMLTPCCYWFFLPLWPVCAGLGSGNPSLRKSGKKWRRKCFVSIKEMACHSSSRSMPMPFVTTHQLSSFPSPSLLPRPLEFAVSTTCGLCGPCWRPNIWLSKCYHLRFSFSKATSIYWFVSCISAWKIFYHGLRGRWISDEAYPIGCWSS